MSFDDDALRTEIIKAAEEINAYYSELRGESPRAAAILAVASLEDEFERSIRSKFTPEVKGSLWKEVAGPGFTPLGSFKARTIVAQAFGFFGPKTRSLLGHIAAVRNKFAHSTDVRHFDHPKVLLLCKKLEKNPFSSVTVDENTKPDDLRLQFLYLVETVEERFAAIRDHLPELGETPPEPLP